MRTVFSLTMTILFLLVSFQQALIVVYFKLNQQQIEQAFCVNKAKPQLQCHGNCHLKKELEKSDKNNDFELNGIGKKIEIALFSNIEFEAKFFKEINSNQIIGYKKSENLEPYLEILVPPPVVFFVNQSQFIT